MVELKLYVLGNSATTFKLTEKLNYLLAAEYQMRYSLEVIDILEHPELAEEDCIFATPMLVKKNPPPFANKILGDPAMAESVMKNMGLFEKEEAK